jgi:hypothetical protein
MMSGKNRPKRVEHFFYMALQLLYRVLAVSTNSSIYNHKYVFRLTRFGLRPLIRPAFIG